MNEDFKLLALAPVEPHQYPDTVRPPGDPRGNPRKPLPVPGAAEVLGYEPLNRRDRRKAAKLLRNKR